MLFQYHARTSESAWPCLRRLLLTPRQTYVIRIQSREYTSASCRRLLKLHLGAKAWRVRGLRWRRRRSLHWYGAWVTPILTRQLIVNEAHASIKRWVGRRVRDLTASWLAIFNRACPTSLLRCNDRVLKGETVRGILYLLWEEYVVTYTLGTFELYYSPVSFCIKRRCFKSLEIYVANHNISEDKRVRIRYPRKFLSDNQYYFKW